MATTPAISADAPLALVTGFQPFGKWSENTARWAARAASEAGQGQVAFLELPVEYGRSATLLIEAIDRLRPRLVASIGMAGTRAEVSIETTAANEDNAELADNAGVELRGVPIHPDGPATASTDFPREELLAHLRAEGYEANLSADAGRFVCNNLFYLVAASLASGAQPKTRFAFIHIPGPTTWSREEAERFGAMLGRWLAEVAGSAPA